MRIHLSRLVRGASLVALLMVSGPVVVSAATGDRHVLVPRERPLIPLGAGGADPIAHATRKVEREIALRVLHERQATSSFFAHPAAGPQPPDRRTRPLVPVTQWSPAHTWPVLQAEGQEAPRITIAAVDPAAGQRTGFVASDLHRLPWAGAPMLPPLVAAPAEAHEPVAVVPLPNAPPVRRERTLAGAPPAHAALLALHRSRSAPSGVPFTRAPRVPLSLPGEPVLALDPLAEPSRDGTQPEKPRLLAPQFILPFENGQVSSLYNQGRRHPAIDLAGKLGAPVFATSNGQKVVFAGARGGYGNAVITRDAEGREHLYGHLSAVQTRVGVTLSQGERLGLLGSTGYSTGPHVHYEVRDRRGAHINPVTLLFPGGVKTGYRWAAVAVTRPAAGATALR